MKAVQTGVLLGLDPRSVYFLRYELTGPFHSCGLMLVVVWLQIQYPGRCAGRVDRYRQEFAYTGSTKWLR